MTIVLVGCDKMPSAQNKANPVSIGMEWDVAVSSLENAGARHIDIEGIEDTDTHIREVNRFLNGTVSLFEISVESRKITDLKVCVDPNLPSEELEWKSVKKFYPGID
jgi:hypothetical protein